MDDESTPVSKILSQMNIRHRLFRHPGPIHSLEQAARERGQKPEQVIRSILFRLSVDDFVMVLVAGGRQIDWRSLRRYLNQTRLTTASKEDVLRVTGYQLGAVSPFGLPTPMRILVDKSVLIPKEISIGSGERGATVIMRTRDFKRALGKVEVVDVGKTKGA